MEITRSRAEILKTASGSVDDVNKILAEVGHDKVSYGYLAKVRWQERQAAEDKQHHSFVLPGAARCGGGVPHLLPVMSTASQTS